MQLTTTSPVLKAARKEEIRRGVREGQKVWDKCEGAGGKGFRREDLSVCSVCNEREQDGGRQSEGGGGWSVEEFWRES